MLGIIRRKLTAMTKETLHAHAILVYDVKIVLVKRHV